MRIERVFNIRTGNPASDCFIGSILTQIGPKDKPMFILVYRGEAHREFMIGLDAKLEPASIMVRRERGKMVDKPTEVGKGSFTRTAMLPAWESAGWDDWTEIELQSHELDAVALMEGFLGTREGKAFLLGKEVLKEDEPKAVPSQPDKLVEIDGYWFRASVERGNWAVYALGQNPNACGEWIGTVEEPTKEAIVEADARFAEACE